MSWMVMMMSCWRSSSFSTSYFSSSSSSVTGLEGLTPDAGLACGLFWFIWTEGRLFLQF